MPEINDLTEVDRRQIPAVKTYALKSDQYRRARGGRAVLLKLSCASCETFLMVYQKDGPGRLLRSYLNRIFDPPKLARIQDNPAISNPGDLGLLTCPTCTAVIGRPMRHLDGRLAFSLQPGTFKKQKYK